MTERQWRLRIVETGKQLAAAGFIPATDGNISVRLNDGPVLITPSGISKGDMEPDDLVVIDMEGRKLRGKGEASSEYDMHLTIYHERPDRHAVVHAHPPYATAFALAGIPLTMPALPEVVLTLHTIPLSDYATPGTPELGMAIAPLVKKHDALLLRNHGAIAAGKDLESAWHNMQRLEHFAKILHLARQLGGEKELDESQIRALFNRWGVQ